MACAFPGAIRSRLGGLRSRAKNSLRARFGSPTATGWSDPVDEYELHPLKTPTFSRRTATSKRLPAPPSTEVHPMNNETKRLTGTFASLILAVLVAGGHARASVLITFEQVDNNVVETGSGAIDLTGLSNTGAVSSTGPNTDPLLALTFLGPVAPFSDYAGYTTITGPSSFGSGTGAAASTGSGDTFGIWVSSVVELVLPQGYVSGTSLSATDTYDNSTFTTLGLTPGTYTYTWGTGASADSLTVQIGPAAVPEPSTAIVAVVGAVAFVTYGWSRHRRHQRTKGVRNRLLTRTG